MYALSFRRTLFIVVLCLLTSATAFRFHTSASETSEEQEDASRALFFFGASSTDDRHNPNTNPRNTTNPPGVPIYTTKPTGRPISKPTRRPTAKPSKKPTAKPTKKPTARPSPKPTRKPTTKPTRKPTSKPTAKPSAKPTAKPSSKPTARPSSKPTARPSARPTANPTAKPTKRPSARPTAKPSLRPTARPSRKPSSRPSRKPTRKPSAKPSRRPSREPTTKTRRPSRRPSARPTRLPTIRRTKRPITPPTKKPSRPPSFSPTRLPTIHFCARGHDGVFGNTSSNNYILIPYNYEMVTNVTTASDQNTTTGDIVLDVEYAITDLLLKSLFSQCASYNDQTRKRWLEMQRSLASGQVIGISAQPNDIQTGDTCDVSSLLPSSNNNNIFSANADPTTVLSCAVLKGRLSIYVDGTLMKDLAGLEALFTLARALIKDGMNGGELALANDAIVVLRYLDDSEKMLAPIAAAIIQKNQNTVLWALLGLLLLLLLLLLALLRRFKRKKKDKEAFHTLENEKDIATVRAYDLEGFSDISSARLSNESDVRNPVEAKVVPPPAPPAAKKTRVAPVKPKEEAPPPTHVRKLTPLQIVGLEDFLESRFAADDEEVIVPKMAPKTVAQKPRYVPYVPVNPFKLRVVKKVEIEKQEEKSLSSEDESILPEVAPLVVAQKSRYVPSGSPNKLGEKKQENETVELKPVALDPPKVSPPPPEDEAAYTFEAMGTNRGIAPKCSICYKDADGWMRSCHCGNKSCDKIAHAACIYGRNPTPSLSYPGTPPPILPPILCGPDNSWMEKRRRASSCDEENVVASTNRDETAYVQGERLIDSMGVMSCMGCRYEDAPIVLRQR